MTLISKSCKIQSPDGSDYCMEIESELNENVLNEQLKSACKKRKFFKSIANDLYDSEIIYQKEIKEITTKIVGVKSNKSVLNKIGIKCLAILIVGIVLFQMFSPLFLIPALVYNLYNLPKVIKLAKITKKDNISDLTANIFFLADKLKKIGDKEKEVKKLIEQTEQLILEIEHKKKNLNTEKKDIETIDYNTTEIEEKFKEINLIRKNLKK